MKPKQLFRPLHFLIIALAVVGLAAVPIPASAQAPPTFSKSFTPSTIGPGSVSTLTFQISNGDLVSPATDIAFTDNLPAGVTIATPAHVLSTCDGLLDAPDGGSTISFSEGRLETSSTCTIHVDVTSSSVSTHANVSGNLTSSAGNSGSASAGLIVDANRPGFSKRFVPDIIPLGGESRLTFLIDNGANAAAVDGLAFTDNLPPGMVVAQPANAATDCSGGFFPVMVTATPGTGTVSLLYGYVPAAGSCTVGVDVTTTWAGTFENTTTELTSQSVSSGKANARLEVRRDFLIKHFAGDPVPPGGSATLTFTLSNLDRRERATGITFSDDLDAALTGLVAVGLPLSDVCGTGSQLSGTSLLTLTGGSLEPESSCSFGVTVQVPAGAAAGAYTNTTSAVNADIGGPTTKAPATAELVVGHVPAFTKHFSLNLVTAGQGVTATFTITNTDATAAATGVAFTDSLDDFFSGIAVTSLPAAGFCGPGSTLVQSMGIPRSLVMSGGSLAPGAACSFDVRFGVPADAPNGIYTNTTSYLSAAVDGTPVSGKPASDGLMVVAAPRLRKSFGAVPVLPGDTANLTFTLTHSENAPAAATAIAFNDDLDATLPGLVTTGLPVQDVCGPGSQLSGTGQLSFTGGSLVPSASCTFSVTLQVPAGALPGGYNNTTSAVTADVAGLAVTAAPAHARLEVGGLALAKSFSDDPAFPGGTVTLGFSLTNSSPVSTVTQIAFDDDLGATLSGLAAVGLPALDVCGAGSQIDGTNLLTFSGGQLAPGASCAFSVTLQIPAAAAPGEYGNRTSAVIAVLGGAPTSALPAVDDLIVSDVLALTKSFGADSVPADSTVALAFSVTNAHPTQSATQLGFSDDLDAVLPGLAATGLPATDVCGAGSQISGTNFLTFSGGGLAPGATCTFSVPLQVPAGALPGTYPNSTSQITGNVGGQPATGSAATDALTISGVPEAGTIVVDKVTVPPGEPASFDFTLAGGLLLQDVPFSLTDASPPEHHLVRPGTGYRVSESVPAGWQLTSAACGNEDPVDDISVRAGETVTCTFTNAGADVAIAKSVSPTVAMPGQAITYTLTFSNVKGKVATGIIISDFLPAGLTATRVLSAGVAITRLLPGYVWAVEPLAPGQGGVIAITGILSETLAAQAVTNTASIAANHDIALANNSSSATVTVEAMPPPVYKYWLLIILKEAEYR